MKFLIESNPGAEEAEMLERKLFQYNGSRIDGYAYGDFIIKAVDRTDAVIAGLYGRIGGGWLYVASLWVEENHRGRGIGRKLLGLAEEAAVQQKCAGAYLYTYSFQSPGFYERLGYAVFGTLENFCESHLKLFMKKRLR